MSKNNTDQGFTEKHLRKTRILVAPLDWGLGHATRCIPIIRQLLAENVDVWLAGEGAQQRLLQQEFPTLPFLELAGYRVRYARSATGLLLSIFGQTHKILSAIKNENAWLKKVVVEYHFDAVISDNRYGLYHSSIPCIFITHQLTIKSPLGKWTERILQKRNYQFINKFTACWVPDFTDENNLAGLLSHPEKKLTTPVYYIGSLSRFHFTNATPQQNHLVVILSGPEPQRTILENKIIEEIAHYPFTATIIRGLPGSTNILPSTSMIKFYNHLPAAELEKEIEQAELIIARTGYSSVMDIVTMQKKAILIPTPGQTEQEYLAEYLAQKKIAVTVVQKNFSLNTSLAIAREFDYHITASSSSEQLLAAAVTKLLSTLPIQ